MADPGKTLFKMLAQSTLTIESVNGLHRQHVASIPNQHAWTLSELARLRQQISIDGIGSNPENEQQYLDLLADGHRLDQSWQMHSSMLDEGAFLAMQVEDDELRKSLLYGQMLLDVYSSGSLSKDARGDVEAIARKLRQASHPAAVALAEELMRL